MKNKPLMILALCLVLGLGQSALAANESVDIVVVGAGGAGLAAAIEASTSGASVILLEKMAFPGGSTVISGGATIAAESSIQKALEVDATAQDFFDFLMAEADGEANSAYLMNLAVMSGETVDILAELGVPWNDERAGAGTPFSDKRFVHSVVGGGPELVRSMREIALEQGVDLRLESPAVGLLTDESGVVGVAVEGPSGAYEIQAKKVILATGSIAGNQELMEELALPFLNNLDLTGTGNTGDGMVWAREIGADVVGQGVIGIRGVNERYGYYGPVGGLVYGSGLYVNLNGERFANERMFYPLFHVEINNQPGKITYAIFDETMHSEALDQAVAEGLAFKADTLEALAMKASMNPEAFAATIEQYNQFYKAEDDKAFGSPADRMTPIFEAPFYAVTARPALIGTIPGLKLDAEGRVVDTEGSAIPNLFAAGDLILGNVFKDTYPTSGGGVGIALHSGRLAAQTAAAELKQ